MVSDRFPKLPAHEMIALDARSVRARYDAGGTGRRMAGWNPPSTGPNRALTGFTKIRDRQRDAVRNDWSGEAGVQRWTTTLVGVGITPRFTSKDARKLWKKSARQTDADNVLDFYGQQTLGTRSWFTSGEVFGRLRYRRADSGLAVPLQLQLVEGDFCPLFDADQWPGMPRGNRIRSGIELTRAGQRVAAWMYREHPGDGGAQGQRTDPSALLRVPFDELIHVFEPTRPGQLRGVSPAVATLTKLRNIADFDDAVLDRQKLANLFTMFITRALPENADIEWDSDTGLPKWYDNDGNPVATLKSGMSQELMPGEDVKFANPPEAGTTFSDYMRTQNLGVAAGQGIPYELFSGDIKEVSDRTLRVLMNEFRRLARARQWQILVHQLCQRFAQAWVETAVFFGKLPATELDTVDDTEWSPEGWEHIHPVQDPQGKIMEIEAGLRSRSGVIRARGDDPETIDDEREEDAEREEARGLQKVDPAAVGNDDGEQDGIAEGEYPQPKKGTKASLIAAQVRLADAQVAALERPAAGPVTTVTVHQAPIQNDITVQPAPVANTVVVEPAPVNNTINVEPTPINNSVNVEPTPINNSVNVEPTPITQTIVAQSGEVTVKLPARKTETSVEYDGKDRIKKSTQIETDAEGA